MNVIGEDDGTTSVRLVVVNYSGPEGNDAKVLAHSTKEIRYFQSGNQYEQSSAEIWKAVCECSRECIEKMGSMVIDPVRSPVASSAPTGSSADPPSHDVATKKASKEFYDYSSVPPPRVKSSEPGSTSFLTAPRMATDEEKKLKYSSSNSKLLPKAFYPRNKPFPNCPEEDGTVEDNLMLRIEGYTVTDGLKLLVTFVLKPDERRWVHFVTATMLEPEYLLIDYIRSIFLYCKYSWAIISKPALKLEPPIHLMQYIDDDTKRQDEKYQDGKRRLKNLIKQRKYRARKRSREI